MKAQVTLRINNLDLYLIADGRQAVNWLWMKAVSAGSIRQ